MLTEKNSNILKAIEKNTRLESYDIDTVSYSLVYPIAVAIPSNGTGLLTNTINLPNRLRSPIRLYGFNYIIRYDLPFVTTPKVSVIISKYTIASNLWTTSANSAHEGVYHIGYHNTIPDQSEVTYHMPRYLNQEDNIEVNLFVENTTAGSFSTTLKCHITLYYRLAETRKYDNLM